MDKSLIYAKPTKNQAAEICALVTSVFDEFIAPGYSQEGVKEFYDYFNVPNITERLNDPNYFAITCSYKNKPIGLIEIRHLEHISLLFVDANFQRKGIAQTLLGKALGVCKYLNPSLEQITVNASPGSVSFYEKLGFNITSEEEVVNGIRFVPMKSTLTDFSN